MGLYNFSIPPFLILLEFMNNYHDVRQQTSIYWKDFLKNPLSDLLHAFECWYKQVSVMFNLDPWTSLQFLQDEIKMLRQFRDQSSWKKSIDFWNPKNGYEQLALGV